MSLEIRVPSLPESVADATVLNWHKQPGDSVAVNENLVDLETDKVVLEVPAPRAGILAEIRAREGQSVKAHDLLALIADAGEVGLPVTAATAPAAKDEEEPSGPGEAPLPEEDQDITLSPSVRRLVKELNLDPSQIHGSGRDGRLLKSDVMNYLDAQERKQPAKDHDALRIETPAAAVDLGTLSRESTRPEQRVPMTRLRARVAERLVQSQSTAAILTTFNEVNMQPVNDLRIRYRELFEKHHEIRVGFMSFFVKAAVEALKRFPVVNASVDGQDIIYHGYYDIGIAVASPRGLVVPILRDCDQLSFAEIERGIAAYGQKAKEGTLSYEDLSGGTFSITNGGIFGSMMSTPILNPPQSAILGMHAIKDRPVVENGQIVIRPMMYLALSYDHRLIDGREAVQFLVTIKECLEDPARLLLQV